MPPHLDHFRIFFRAMKGGEPVLVWPDERWRLTSIDFVPWASQPVVLPVIGPTPIDLDGGATRTVRFRVFDGETGELERVVADGRPPAFTRGGLRRNGVASASARR